METRRLCTFHLDGLFLGVDVREVREVIGGQDMTPVPLAPAAIAGLINLRGQIVAVVDLRQRLKLTPRSGGGEPMHVVVQAEGDIASLLVDEVGEVVEVGEANFEPMPATVSILARELIQGAYKLEDQLLLRLDIRKTLDLA